MCLTYPLNLYLANTVKTYFYLSGSSGYFDHPCSRIVTWDFALDTLLNLEISQVANSN